MSNLIFPDLAPDIYGPLISAAEVRQAVLATIEAWSAAYIAVVAARTGAALLPFATYEATYDRRQLPANGAAACWVVCPGTGTPPKRQGTGLYIAEWVAEVQVVVYGSDWATTSDFAARYGLAVRALLLQHGSLGGIAEATEVTTKWLREKYSLVEAERQSTVGILQTQFAVTVNGVTNTSAGPKVLPVAPALAPVPGTPGGPNVLGTNVTLIKTGVDG